MIIRILMTVSLVLFDSSSLLASHILNPEQSDVIAAWLKAHPSYRLANDKDCGCDVDLQRIRAMGYGGGGWKPLPSYGPYTVSGDFNGDGEIDFAVAVIRTNDPHKFTMLVFNGPVDLRHPVPAFIYPNKI